MVVRTAFTFALRYNKDDQPLYTFNWNYPLRLALWEVTLDYLFVSLCFIDDLAARLLMSSCRNSQYCYHRLTHEVDFLWAIHQHHHTTKHPTPILSSELLFINPKRTRVSSTDFSPFLNKTVLAESRQEFLEVFSIPFVTSLLVPMSFSELYLTMCYTLVSK